MSNQGPHRRAAYTLLELVIAGAVSALLVGGLASMIYLANRALQGQTSGSMQIVEAKEVIDEVAGDLLYATSFSERTANAITFQRPDRDGDDMPETIRYAWSGTAGDPLLMTYNGGTPAVLADRVQTLNLSYLLRPVTGTGFVKGMRGEVLYWEFTEARQVKGANDITIAKPSGTANGHLLIAAVTVAGTGSAISFTAPAGWTGSWANYANMVHIGVWWKIAAAEPSSYTFLYSGSKRRSYAWIMRFTGHNPANPIHAWATLGGISQNPVCPSVATTVYNCMILRLGTFDEYPVTVDAPGLPGHTPITMDRADASGDTISGGAGYIVQEQPGDCGESTFSLTASQEYRTVTIAIEPAM